MCGFVISIGNFLETELKKATRSISHRGPDDTQFYFNDRFKIKIGIRIITTGIAVYGIWGDIAIAIVCDAFWRVVFFNDFFNAFKISR